MYSSILTENNNSNLRYVANRHDFVTWSGAGQVGAPLSNVFSPSNFTSAFKVEGGKAYLNGPLYDFSSNSMWIPGSTVSWQSALTQAVINVPTGGVFTYSASNAIYRYMGNDVVYNVNVSGTITTQPTAGASADYTLAVPQPVNTATYTAGTIIGELWLLVTNASSSNTFKAFARANADANVATLRVLSGTTETSLGSIVAGNAINLQGTLTYTTPLINNANGLPVTYTPAAFVQDQLGAVSLGSGQAPRAQYDVVGTRSNLPALVVDQQAAVGDVVRVMKSGLSKVVVDGEGNVGIGTSQPQGLLHLVGTTSNVVVDSQGYVGIGTTAPQFQIDAPFAFCRIAVPHCRVLGASCGGTISNSVSMTNDIYYRVQYQTVIENSYSLYNVTNRYVQAPMSGLYYVHATASFSAGTGQQYNLSFVKNATLGASTSSLTIYNAKVANATAPGNGYATVATSTVIPLIANDYLEFYVRYDDSVASTARFRQGDLTTFSWVNPVLTAYMVSAL